VIQQFLRGDAEGPFLQDPPPPVRERRTLQPNPTP